MTHGLDVKPRRPQIESILSREFTFVLNNWILCSLLFFILVATTFPLISEALTGEKVTVGPPFYKVWVQPLGLVLLLLMGVGTCFGWKKTSPDGLRRAFRIPTIVFVAAAVLHFAVGGLLGFPAVVYSDAIYPGVLGAVLRGFNAFMPVLGFSLCVFNAAVIVQEFVQLFRSRARSGANARTPAILWWLGGLPGLVYTLVSLAPTSRRRYGGYVVHFGIVLMFIGFTGQSWNVDRETSLSPGQSYSVAGYTLTYTREHMEVDNNKRMVFAEVEVAKHGHDHHQAVAREVHLQEATRLADDRGRDRAPLRGRRVHHRRLHQSTDEGRRIPDPPQPPRQLDLDRVHRAHHGQHRLDVAPARARRVPGVGRGARRRCGRRRA